jgi:hypothetical protein
MGFDTSPTGQIISPKNWVGHWKKMPKYRRLSGKNNQRYGLKNLQKLVGLAGLL